MDCATNPLIPPFYVMYLWQPIVQQPVLVPGCQAVTSPAVSGKPHLQPNLSKCRPSKVPKPLQGKDEVAVLEKDECQKCQIYKGRVALKPCGHGLFCFKCVNKLRKRGMKMRSFRPICLNDDCPFAISGWTKPMMNVNTTQANK